MMLYIVVRRLSVWAEKNAPTKFYDSVDEAKAEAERLAKVNPGAQFYVCSIPIYASVIAAKPVPAEPVVDWTWHC